MSAPTASVYTMATSPTPTSGLSMAPGSSASYGGVPPPPSASMFYGGVDDSLLYGSALYTGASSSFGSGGNPVFSTEDHVAGAQDAPKFYKLEFLTYDIEVDPLNWLNHYEQFFRGQCSLLSDCTCSLRTISGAQRRHGTTHWSRTRACLRGSVSTSCASCNSALQCRVPGWLNWLTFRSSQPSRSTRCATMSCSVTLMISARARRRSCLRVGCQSTSRWKWISEIHPTFRRLSTWREPSSVVRWLFCRPHSRVGTVLPANHAPFRHLQRGLQRHLRQQPRLPRDSIASHWPNTLNGAAKGSANCDEPFVRGHVCQRLFYLESGDYLDDDIPADVAVAALGDEPPTDPTPTAAACALTPETGASPTVSLYALAGVRTENAMLLPAIVHGHCVVVLLDSGSTTNFINAAAAVAAGHSPLASHAGEGG